MVKKLSGLAGITAVKSGIECIEVPGVQVILGNAQGFTEALVVDDLPGSEELDGFTDIRILDQAQNVVVGGAGFLFRSTEQIKADNPDIPAYETYEELLTAITAAL